MIALAIAVDASLLAPELALGARWRPPARFWRCASVQFNLASRTPIRPRRPTGSSPRTPAWCALEEAHGAASMVVERLRPSYPFVADCLGQARRCSTMLLLPAAPRRLGPAGPWRSGERGRAVRPVGPLRRARRRLRWSSPTSTGPRPFGSGGRDRATLQRFLAKQPADDLVMAGDFNLAVELRLPRPDRRGRVDAADACPAHLAASTPSGTGRRTFASCRSTMSWQVETGRSRPPSSARGSARPPALGRRARAAHNRGWMVPDADFGLATPTKRLE